VHATCQGCNGERGRSPVQRPRVQRNERIAALERQRRTLIAALVKIDAEIAELRGRPAPPSAAFERVEPSDVFDSGDNDLGFGD
jgi:hypothetical protein